jgi:hypothetical protein
VTTAGDGPASVPRPEPSTGLRRVASALGLERNTSAVVAAMFLMALGENLWRRFMLKYLEALGAPIVAIGAYGSTEDLLDGLYQYSGGWVGDRYGRRRADMASGWNSGREGAAGRPCVTADRTR